MNPLKLFDAGAGLLSSAVKSTANMIKQGPSVAERIASMVKRDDEDDAAFKIEQMKIVVSTEKVSDADSAILRLTVSDKRNNAEVAVCERKWAEVEQVSQFIRGLYPKLDVPAAPPRAGARAVAVVVEERRKYAQAFLNVCVSHAAASKTKELHHLIGVGLTGPLAAQTAALNASPSGSVVPSSSGILLPSNSSLSMQQSIMTSPSSNNSFSSPPRGDSIIVAPNATPSRQVSFAASPPAATPSPSAPTSAAPDAATDDRTLIDECFKVVDVDNSGYVTMDELEDFVRSLPKHVSSRAVAQCVEEADADKTGAFDAKAYRTFMTRLAQVTRVGILDMWRGFRRVKLQQVYEAVTDAEAADRFEISRAELKPLLAILQTGGLRQLSHSALANVDFQLPYAFTEFEDVMDHLFRAIPPHELLKGLRISGVNNDTGVVLSVINRYAAKAPGQLVRTIKDLVGRYGGTSCSNCAAVQAKQEAAEAAARQLRLDKENLQAQLVAVGSQLAAAQSTADQATDAISQRDKQIEDLGRTIAKLQAQLGAAAAEKENLLDAVCNAQAELDLERQKAKADAAGLPGFEYATDSDEETPERKAAVDAALAATRVNMYFLMPQHLGSSDSAPVVDQPGSLVYNLVPPDEAGASTYQPMGFATDVFVADTKVHEYISLRSAEGKRSVALVIEGGAISCPWDSRSATLPSQRWIRLSLRFRWDSSSFDVVIDGKSPPEMQSIPFRDTKFGVSGASVLDIFPRDVVAVYYANMHFFR